MANTVTSSAPSPTGTRSTRVRAGARESVPAASVYARAKNSKIGRIYSEANTETTMGGRWVFKQVSSSTIRCRCPAMGTGWWSAGLCKHRDLVLKNSFKIPTFPAHYRLRAVRSTWPTSLLNVYAARSVGSRTVRLLSLVDLSPVEQAGQLDSEWGKMPSCASDSVVEWLPRCEPNCA